MRELVRFLARLSDVELEIVEQGVPPATEDIVIGDPARFKVLLRRDRLTPIEDVLVAAYHHAMKTHGLRPRDHVCELDWRRERP